MKRLGVFICFLFFLLLYPTVIYAQKDKGQSYTEINFLLPDSVVEWWDIYKKNPQSEIPSLFRYIDYLQQYCKNIDYKQVIQEEIIPLQKVSNPYYRAYAFYLEGAYHLLHMHLEKAPQCLGSAWSECQHLENNQYTLRLKIRTKLAIGAYYFFLANWDQGLKVNEEARELNKELHDQFLEASIVNNKAVIYKNLNQNHLAIEIFKENLKYTSNIPDFYALTLCNIADSYLNLQQSDSAFRYIRKALQTRQKSINNYSLPNTYYLLGKAWMQKGLPDSAFHYMEYALDMARKNKEGSVELQVLYEMSLMYAEEGNIQEALRFNGMMIEISEKANNFSVECMALKHRSAWEEALGRNTSAYHTLKKYAHLRDSLEEIESKEKAHYDILQNQFTQEQQQLEFALRESQLKLQTTTRIHRILFAGIFTIAILIGFMIVILMKKKNAELKNKELSEQNLLDKLEIHKKELVNQAMFLMNKEELIKKIISQLEDIESGLENDKKKKIHELINSLNYSINTDILSEFEASFSQVHSSFFEKLVKDFPNLTVSEKRLCAFIKLNLTTKEIASITNLDPNSIRVARVRLRKKLQLTGNDQSLYDFISRY